MLPIFIMGQIYEILNFKSLFKKCIENLIKMKVFHKKIGYLLQPNDIEVLMII